MKLVIIESPLSGNFKENKDYARKCMRDSLMKGEAPYASHLLYDQEGILDDTILEERELGIKAGFYWGDAADYIVVYIDKGISSGMVRGIKKADNIGKEIYYRSLEQGEVRNRWAVTQTIINLEKESYSIHELPIYYEKSYDDVVDRFFDLVLDESDWVDELETKGILNSCVTSGGI